MELRAESLVVVLGTTRVLRGADARFEAGTLHVVEGANGSGKSTLLGVLGGRLLPASGRAVLSDASSPSLVGSDLRRRVGWLGHDLGLYPDLTAFENVALHAGLRGLDAHEAWTTGATSLGVEAVGKRRVRELSRGQRQRVALVRALVGSPAVLLLDEPSTGLDVAATDLLAAALDQLRSRGLVVLVVTHDSAFRDRLAPTLWRLTSGKITRAV